MENPSKSPSKYSYKITNWREYNHSLKKRGKVSIWISSQLLSLWKEIDVRKIVFGEQIYPDSVVEFCLLIKHIYHLPLRQTTGFVDDLLNLYACKNYCVPNYTTLSRRSKALPVCYAQALKAKKGLHIMVDSTGIKVYGEGEWKVKKHGIAKHRTWLKLHLCVDAQSQEIVGMSLTDNSIDDAHAAQEMLNAAPLPMLSIRGDGAYDKFFFREKLGNEVQQIIPPPRNAVLKNGMEKIPIPNYLVQRNKAVERIKEVGRKAWKEEINYHRRSLVETTMFRYKVIFGDKSTARIKENQETDMGMPKTTKIFKN